MDRALTGLANVEFANGNHLVSWLRRPGVLEGKGNYRWRATPVNTKSENAAGARASLSIRIQKVLADAYIELAGVATDVLGASGRHMLEALIAGRGSVDLRAVHHLHLLSLPRTATEPRHSPGFFWEDRQ
jgi:hypothetical protein